MLYYNITKNTTISTMRNCFLAALFFIPTFVHAIEQADNVPLKVVASIKPIHSIVASIMQGVGQPELLLHSSQSPHHYSLRPSERQKLARADLIFWIGPTLESFMPRLLHSLDKKIKFVTLINTEGLMLLPKRLTENHFKTKSTIIDAHIWMNTGNIEIMMDEITRQLVSMDPANAQQYKKNHKALYKKIRALKHELGLKLKDKQRPFLTYHDGYQYFEQEFNLNNTGFISSDTDLQPSVMHIQKMKNLIREHSIQCIFYDAPFEPPIMASLLAGNRARAVELDPTGIRMAAGKNTLFQIMKNLGENIQSCL